MFSGSANNPYDDIVAKTTDENLTTENWELILNLCDKVSDEGEEGARNVIAAVLKRLAHRNPNVQLYALTLAESLSKNCGIEIHRELASKAFTQGLEKLVTDRTTHDKVKRRILGLIATWTAEFQSNTELGIMEECYDNLKSKNYKFEVPEEAPPPNVDDEIRRKEEEELQRVLEMSMQDKGGRGQWSEYTIAGAGSSSSAGGAGSSSHARTGSASAFPPSSSSQTQPQQPHYPGGYVPARASSPQQLPQPQSAVSPAPAPLPATSAIITRVRALHAFEPTEPGELGFQQGDIIKVVDRGYKDWWRGQLKGRTGIFPVNYVEPLPEPTVEELAREAEQEAAVFAQAVNVEKLLNMLRAFDPNQDNLADNEEIQELYRTSMALRPKIVKLIDKYSQKRADLVSMNETFVRARTIFDRMMEESLAKHSGLYAEQPGYRPYVPSQQAPPQPQSQEYPWSQPQAPYPAANPTPAPYLAHATPAPAAYQNVGVTPTPGGYGAPPYGGPQPHQQPQQPQQQPVQQQQQQQQGPPPAWQAQAPVQSPQGDGGFGRPTSSGGPSSPGAQWQAQPPAAAYPQPQQPVVQPQPYGAQGPTPYPSQEQAAQPQPQHSPVVAHQGQPHAQQPQPYQQQQPQHQPQPQAQPQPQSQPQPQQSQPQPQPQAQPQPQQQQPQQKHYTNGPPYVFDPNGIYPDANAQAWAQYYAAGGQDLTGAVYFISVPGLTDEAGHPLGQGDGVNGAGGLAGQFGAMRVGGDLT